MNDATTGTRSHQAKVIGDVMTRTDWMSIAMVMLVIALPTHGQEVPISAAAPQTSKLRH